MVDSKLLFEHGIANYNSYGRYHNDSPQPGGIIHDSDTKFAADVYNTFEELAELLIKKNKDYGPSNIGDSPGGPINGLRVRMYDKIARINNLYEKNKEPENEPFEDAFKDLANYSVIGMMVLRGQWPK